MLISDSAVVKSSKYYEELGYDISEKYITVKIENVPNSSRAIIEANCDYCGRIKSLSYKDYNANIKNLQKFSCSKKCGILKSIESNKLKYGVESVNQLESKKQRAKSTLQEKFGVLHPSQIESVKESKSKKMIQKSSEISERIKTFYDSLSESDLQEINQKRKNTNLEKWGVENISSLQETKNKVRERFNKEYGGFTLQSKDLLDKVHKTNVEKWGTIYPSQNSDIREKIKSTNLEKWGFTTPSKSVVVKTKIIDTLRLKFGVDNIMFSDIVRSQFKVSNEENYVGYLGQRVYQFRCNSCENIYEIDYDNYYKRNLRKVNPCTKCFPISQNSSIKEIELRNFIVENYDGEILTNFREGLEIDIYLPDINLGFEFNGLYWHSKLPKYYHLQKKNHFAEKNIKIINIWEDDWTNRREIIKSQIRYLLHRIPHKIMARNCEIREIFDAITYKEFLNENHIQGYIRSIIKIGLFHGQELVSIMTFDNSEGRKKMNTDEWNLSRFCNKINISIPGAASKLLSYFIKKYKPKRIISFADFDWSNGDLYYKLGFDLVKKLKPDYKYVVDGNRINKQRLTKKKLYKNKSIIDMTESQITNLLEIPKIYNVGQLKFEKNF